MTCARTAPMASARSRTLVRSSPWPRSRVTAMISAPYFSASHGMATDVSSPPEYARTIRLIFNKPSRQWGRPSVRMFASRPDASKALPHRERCGIYKDRVVAGNGADDFRQRRAIDRHGQRLRLSGIGFQDHQLIDDVVAAKVVVD